MLGQTTGLIVASKLTKKNFFDIYTPSFLKLGKLYSLQNKPHNLRQQSDPTEE